MLQYIFSHKHKSNLVNLSLEEALAGLKYKMNKFPNIPNKYKQVIFV